MREQGWRVVVWDRHATDGEPTVDVADYASVAAAVRSDGEPTVDVADYASVAAAASRLDGVDLLINAAGIAGSRDPVARGSRRMGPGDGDQPEWCVPLRACVYERARGVVVNIASVAGMVMMKGRAHYAVSKAGVATLTRSLANEWAEDGIRVIAVAPGYVKTPMIQRSIEAGELDERKLAAMHPLNRLATTQEIAAAMIALARAVPVHDRRGRDHRRRNDIGKIGLSRPLPASAWK